MSFIYHRTVRFQDTDAAGVVYFANVLAICHEAYEESLAEVGINVKQFFRGEFVAVPIGHATIEFLRPIYVGDRLTVRLQANALREGEFEVNYEIELEGDGRGASNDLKSTAAHATTRHVCIDPETRERRPLLSPLQAWLQQS
jgi:1,4-dihydroxy-2-naphthoyl-CoA hydrolase